MKDGEGRECFYIDIRNCARCGGEHGHTIVTEFARPVTTFYGTIFRWWARCPNSGEPILVEQTVAGS